MVVHSRNSKILNGLLELVVTLGHKRGRTEIGEAEWPVPDSVRAQRFQSQKQNMPEFSQHSLLEAAVWRVAAIGKCGGF